MVEFQHGMIVEFHFVVMLREMAVVDTGLREMRLHEQHDFGSDFAVVDGYTDLLALPLLLVDSGSSHCVFVGRGSIFLATGRHDEGQCRDCGDNA